MSAADATCNCEHCGSSFLSSEVPLCPACSIAEVFSLNGKAKPALAAELLDGKYLPGEMLGEGGFGIVYRAEQLEPIRRSVAIKIIRPGADGRSIAARFEAERQALALLDHTNIAKIYDAGETDDGQPFFAMELVEGEAITDHCETEELSERRRLELFATVCDAVAHVHGHGIIHRDIKPSNVIVTAAGTPKVIDFGIAKATRTLLTERTLLTGAGQFLGTPGYVSPEQAATSGRETDARSDVYSLGALLYQMLTSTAPLDTESLRDRGIEEVLRMIREDPPPPSTLPQELDRILRHALEKEPDRRYPSAADFAADVRRYLNDEPIEARAPRLSYRLLKIVRQQKAIVAALVVAGAGIAAGLFIALREEPNLQPADFTYQRAELGDTHPATIAALYHLVEDLKDRGEHGKAERLLTGNLNGSRDNSTTAASLAAIGERYANEGRIVEAERALDHSLEIRRKLFGNTSQEVLDSLIQLCELEISNLWIRQTARGPLFLEAAQLSRQLHGDAALITAQCAARLGADYGFFLGVDQTLSFLRDALGRATSANAPTETIQLLETEISRLTERRASTRASAAKDLLKYEQALATGDHIEAINHLRLYAYRLGWAGDLVKAQIQSAKLLKLAQQTDLPLTALYHNHVIEGWLAWRSGERERSVKIHTRLLNENLLSPELDSNARSRILRNLQRPIWDSGSFTPYWEIVDRFEDRAAEAIWPAAKTKILLPRGSRWAHAPAPQDSHWAAAGSDIETSWKRGHAPFSDYRIPVGCRLPPLRANTPITRYFRTRFELAEPNQLAQLKIRITRWAGAAIFINGAEVARHNLADAAAPETPATVPEGGGQARAHVILIDPSALRAGSNLIAVEVHRYALERYLYFDLQLEGQLRD